MTDCSSIHGSTSSSSDVLSSRGGGGVMSPRIRVIRLVRPSSKRVLLGPESNASFGFAVRGGKEFGSGFFVSRVDKGSDADVKGVRVGDQIIRVNGYQIDDAVHKEFAQLVSNQDRLTLKVRGVGMLPVKEKPVDLLTWHIVPHHALTSIGDLEDLPPPKEIRVVLKVAPRTKLGLGICKGPEWKPGIYVQFTKEFSVARDAGLRPGDQILSCNSIDFSDVLFSEAVAVMKSAHTLEMFIRPGAGLDLFPGESSGYNSSASSVTGDQSPCWGDQSAKRLSIVREENSGSQLRSSVERSHLDRRKSCVEDTIPEEGPKTRSDANRTIIQLSGTGTVINNTLISNGTANGHQPNGLDNVTIKQNNHASSCSHAVAANEQNFIMAGDVNDAPNADLSSASTSGKIADICLISRQSETKTVIVEVHRSAAPAAPNGATTTAAEENTRVQSDCETIAPMGSTPHPPPPMPPPAFPNFSQDTLERCPSAASSIMSAGSLSSAISEEFKKRQRRCHDPNQINDSTKFNIDHSKQSQSKRFGNPSLGGGTENVQRHHALMDEFKRAHRKMFRNGFQETEKEIDEERQDELSKAVVMRDETDHAPSSPQIKTENPMQAFPTPPPPPQFANGYNEKSNINNNNTTINSNEQILRKSPPKQQAIDQPPSSPTPDYDSTPTSTLSKTNGIHKESNYDTTNMNGSTLRRAAAASELVKANGEAAEMESLESFKLKNPSSPVPRPPSLYFAPQNSGPPTMKKTTRSVSVTIGEYGACNGRKEPGKFDFIAKSPENGHVNGNGVPSKDENVSEMLRSELEKTLSRSNLKKMNETKCSTNGEPNAINLVTTNGNCEKVSLHKTQSANIQRLASLLQNKQLNGMDLSTCNGNGSISSSNRVSIDFSGKAALRKVESSPPSNGILKNGFGKTASNGCGEKNITFGN